MVEATLRELVCRADQAWRRFPEWPMAKRGRVSDAALQPAALDPLGAFLGRAQRFVDVLPLRRLRSGIETINVSLRSFQSLWYRLASAATLAADVAVLPDLRDFWFLQFGEAARIIECGRAQAADSLPAIRKMLKDRVGLKINGG